MGNKTKLEECARVLCKAAGRNPDYVWTDGKPQWTMYVDDARAVIRCLMEANERMVSAGFERQDFDDSLSAEAETFNKRNCGYVFRAMLQSVLDEGK